MFKFDFSIDSLLVGAVLGSIISCATTIIVTYRNNKWNKREETYRMLRYAIDLTCIRTIQEIPDLYLGISLLASMTRSPLLQKEDIDIVRVTLLHIVRSTHSPKNKEEKHYDNY